jgi:NitT/TauT family transport system substrate-binding protein
MFRPVPRQTVLAFAATLSAMILLPAAAPAETKVMLPALTFPTIINTAGDIIKAKGLDKANGLDAEIVAYGTPGAQLAGIAKGEVIAGVQSPYVIAKMRSEGVPLSIAATFVGMEDTQIVTKDPSLKGFADLKGKMLAATVGFSAYQYLEIYSKRLGLKLNSDIQIVNATTANAQAQLEADRVDAILTWEPATTRVLKQIPTARVIFTGDQGWKAVTGDAGWDIVLWVNTNWVKANPGALVRLLKMYADYGAFMNNNPMEADAIISSDKYTSKGIPPDTIATAVKSKRLVVNVMPAWNPNVNRQVWQMLEIGANEGFLAAAADRDTVLNSAPAP